MTGKTETPDLLMDLFRKMQGAAASYIEPTTYNQRSPSDGSECARSVEPPAHNHTEDMKRAIKAQRSEMFINDIIHMLDGPEQRAAEADRNKPAPAVALKPLVWVKECDFHCLEVDECETIIGKYSAYKAHDRDGWSWSLEDGPDGLEIHGLESMDAAKDGAWSVYKVRVADVIRPAPLATEAPHIARDAAQEAMAEGET